VLRVLRMQRVLRLSTSSLSSTARVKDTGDPEAA
jgi:hypothetical protein